MIKYCFYTPGESKVNDLDSCLRKFDDYFIPKISERQSIQQLVNKFQQYANVIICKSDERIIGLTVFYLNQSPEYSYLSIIAVDESFRELRVGKSMMQMMINYSRKINSKGIKLEVRSESDFLINFYRNLGFIISDEFVSKYDYKKKYYMQLDFDYIPHFQYQETPIEYLSSFSLEQNNSFWVKRDDLFTIAGGGNKARKLQYILYKAINEKYDSVVTTGDINSNHNRATALMCAKLGLKLKLVIHNNFPEKEKDSLNMFFSRIVDADILYCSKKDVGNVMDQCMNDFKEKGYKPFYIWGGGHSLEGAYAYFDAVKNLSYENKKFDYIFFASGTGTTHVGMHLGAQCFLDQVKVVGISIARDKERGIKEIYSSIKELENYLKIDNYTEIDSISFVDDYLTGGYEESDEDILSIIRKLMKEESLFLDPTYTGKAYYGMLEYLVKNKIQNKNILFWHTGGLFNLLSARQLF